MAQRSAIVEDWVDLRGLGLIRRTLISTRRHSSITAMAFTDLEIAEHTLAIEKVFWSRRRPPLHLREKMREGQRFAGHSVELFFVRPAYNDPGRHIEESIAKITFVRSRCVWRLFWKRADLKWHGYQPHSETRSLRAGLQVIDEDAYNCFFG